MKKPILILVVFIYVTMLYANAEKVNIISAKESSVLILQKQIDTLKKENDNLTQKLDKFLLEKETWGNTLEKSNMYFATFIAGLTLLFSLINYIVIKDFFDKNTNHFVKLKNEIDAELNTFKSDMQIAFATIYELSSFAHLTNKNDLYAILHGFKSINFKLKSELSEFDIQDIKCCLKNIEGCLQKEELNFFIVGTGIEIKTYFTLIESQISNEINNAIENYKMMMVNMSPSRSCNIEKSLRLHHNVEVIKEFLNLNSKTKIKIVNLMTK